MVEGFSEFRIDDNGVSDWEAGLPSSSDLMPLSQSLIPPELASAFKISPEDPKTMLDVNRASNSTLSSLNAFDFKPYVDLDHHHEEEDEGSDPDDEGSDPKRIRRTSDDLDQSTAKNPKRPRLVWTPQLHKRFVEVVAHLGLKSAVPKTIMQMMNVEGLTRENVASHLQKYRLYVKRMQGGEGGPSTSDHLFDSTPVPQKSLNESTTSNNNGNEINNRSDNQMRIPMMPYPHPMQISGGGFNMYDSSHNQQYQYQYQQQYNSMMMMHQQRDWSANNYSNYSQKVSSQNNK